MTSKTRHPRRGRDDGFARWLLSGRGRTRRFVRILRLILAVTLLAVLVLTHQGGGALIDILHVVENLRR